MSAAAHADLTPVNAIACLCRRRPRSAHSRPGGHFGNWSAVPGSTATRRPLRRAAPSTLALHLEELRDGARPEIERLLARLARYGDRIAVRLPEGWQRALAVDSSMFELVLGDE